MIMDELYISSIIDGRLVPVRTMGMNVKISGFLEGCTQSIVDRGCVNDYNILFKKGCLDGGFNATVRIPKIDDISNFFFLSRCEAECVKNGQTFYVYVVYAEKTGAPKIRDTDISKTLVDLMEKETGCKFFRSGHRTYNPSELHPYV